MCWSLFCWNKINLLKLIWKSTTALNTKKKNNKLVLCRANGNSRVRFILKMSFQLPKIMLITDDLILNKGIR